MSRLLSDIAEALLVIFCFVLLSGMLFPPAVDWSTLDDLQEEGERYE